MKKPHGQPFRRLALALLIVASALLAWFKLTDGHHWGDDHAGLILQSRSLVRGEISTFLETNRFTVEESTDEIGPVAYPWGGPVLLVPFLLLFGEQILWLKLLNLVCYLVFLAALGWGFKNILPDAFRLLLVGFFAFNPYLLSFLNNITADIPFLLLSTVTILQIRRNEIEGRYLISHGGDRILLGALLALAIWVRLNGLLLVITLAVVQVARLLRDILVVSPDCRRDQITGFWRNFRSDPLQAVTALSPYLVFTGLTLIFNALLPGGGSSHFRFYTYITPATLLTNTGYYLGLGADLFNGLPWKNLFYWIGSSLFLIGAIYDSKKSLPFLLYILLTFMLVILWPGRQGLRYIFPVLPFATSLSLTGILAVKNRLRPVDGSKWILASTIGLALVVVGFTAIATFSAIRNMQNGRDYDSGPYTSQAMAVWSYIARATPPESVIIFFKPRALTQMTGRQSIEVDESDKLELGQYLCLYLGQEAYNQIPPAEADRLVEAGTLEMLYSNDYYRFYRIRR